jgi:hypothetical protein
MGSRLKLALLAAVALVALAACAIVVYSFVTNDWRLAKSALDIHLFPGRENDIDSRVASHRWGLALPAYGAVVVDATGANVQVATGTGDSVIVECWLEGDATDSTKFAVSARLEGPSTLHVTAQPTQHWLSAVPGKARMTVTIPGPVDLRAKVYGGETVIDGVQGTILAEVTGRNLNVFGVSGQVTLKTTRGDINVERSNISGSLDAGHGQINMSYTDGAIHAAATSGVNARSHLGTLDATASEGGINAELIGANSSCRLVSLLGDIQVWLLPSAHVTLDLQCYSGHITESLPLDSASVLDARADRLRGAMNGGGDSVVVRARSGGITLYKYGESTGQGDTSGHFP